MQELINSYKREITHKDNPSSHKLESTEQVRKNTNQVKTPKYKLTLEFTGTADDNRVEEEIITILKGQFLSKYTTDKSNTTALQSLSNKEVENK